MELSGPGGAHRTIPRERHANRTGIDREFRFGRRRCVWTDIQSFARAIEYFARPGAIVECRVAVLCAGNGEDGWGGNCDGKRGLSLCGSFSGHGACWGITAAGEYRENPIRKLAVEWANHISVEVQWA